MQAESHLELVDRAARLYELKSEWSALARAIPGCTPFQLPEWMITWWRHFGNGDLHTLIFRHDGRMVGILPAFLHEWRGRRQITLIGSGISDYLDPPIDARFTADVIDGLTAHLESDAHWDICDWQDLPAVTPLQKIQPGRSFEVALKSDTECTGLVLPPTLQEFWSGMSKDLRRNVVRYRKRAEMEGKLEFEAVSESRPELLDSFIALHTARWQARGEAGMIEANHSARFLREIAGQFAALDILCLFVLRFQNEIAAMIVSFVYEGTLFFYLSAFDPHFEFFSPGQILLSECLRYSYEHKFRAWNFLRGIEPYKLAWGATPVSKCRVVITRS